VATRFQQRLESFSTRSPYHAAAQTVLHRAVPFINSVLFGQQLQLTCVNGVFLASKRCEPGNVVPQHAHRDWPHEQLMDHKSAGFPVGVLISVMDGGKLHLWPDSLDSAEVSRADMITVDLNAGDIVLFNGTLAQAMLQQMVKESCTLEYTCTHAALNTGVCGMSATQQSWCPAHTR
jgi:ectoine hydroxylase-related dioxygenase (phytanoyl-CoA dioxygenase family)